MLIYTQIMKTRTIVPSLMVLFLMVSEYTLQAQTFKALNRNKNFIGFTFNGGFGKGFVGNVGLRYGRFLANRFVAGGEFIYGSNGPGFKEFKPGIFARYYLLNKKFAPFVETSAYHSMEVYETTPTTYYSTYNEARLGGGLAFNGLIKDKLCLELNAGYTTKKNYFYGGLRLTYHFGKD